MDCRATRYHQTASIQSVRCNAHVFSLFLLIINLHSHALFPNPKLTKLVVHSKKYKIQNNNTLFT